MTPASRHLTSARPEVLWHVCALCQQASNRQKQCRSFYILKSRLALPGILPIVWITFFTVSALQDCAMVPSLTHNVTHAYADIVFTLLHVPACKLHVEALESDQTLI